MKFDKHAATAAVDTVHHTARELMLVGIAEHEIGGPEGPAEFSGDAEAEAGGRRFRVEVALRITEVFDDQ